MFALEKKDWLQVQRQKEIINVEDYGTVNECEG